MADILTSPSLNLLRNRLDYRRVPFSDRGSRLLVFLNPEQSSIYIRLAERLISLEADVEAYLRRAHFIHDLTFINQHGEALEYETTTYPHLIYFNTELGEFGLTFQNDQTLAVGLPPGITAGVKFHISPQFWKTTNSGGEFKSIRNLSYDTNAEIVKNGIVPERGGYTVLILVESGDDSTITLNIGSDPVPAVEVPSFSSICDITEARWKDWFEKIPLVSDTYAITYTYAWWVMANNLVRPKGSIFYEAMMPSKVNYVGLWLWDSAMHALAFRHVDPQLARNQIRAILESQLPDGMLPDAVYDDGVVSEIDHPIYAEVTKPPILAWAALKLHESAPDLDFLEEIYVPLVRWNAWWFSMNDDDVDGLAQYNHPYSSGLDDSPLWDFGMPVESPDLNTYLCIQMGSLAMMAEFLGMDTEAQMWRRRSKAIVHRMIQDFWDEESGLFRAVNENGRIPVVTPFNLYPLWTGQLPDEIRDRLIGHLTNPDEFWGEYMLPSVARNDPLYDPSTMWRGPVWVNINYFFIEALRQIGEEDLADELTQKTLDLIMSHPGIFEYYQSDNGEPSAKAAEAFGWTAAVFIDLAISASRSQE
jgi:hypothetical protein